MGYLSSYLFLNSKSEFSDRPMLVAGRYGVLGFRSGSIPRTQVGSLSRHKSSENSPLSALGEIPSANSLSRMALVVYDRFSLVFIPHSSREAA